MTESGFTISVSQNKYLARREREMHAVVSVTATGLGRHSGQGAAGPEAAEVILVDCSGSMDYPPTKISAARRATRAAIDVLRDGVLFAVVQGTDQAYQVYPTRGGLAVASAETRAEARFVVDRLRAGGGTAMGSWLTLAGFLLGEHATAIRHAMLFTDGYNQHETPAHLTKVLDKVRGRFVCDVRGIGEDWEPTELLRIASVLNGQASAVRELADLPDDFRSLMADAMRKVVPDVDLRLNLINGVRLLYFKQVHPTMTDLTGQLDRANERIMRLRTGSWADETRDYQIGIEVPRPDSAAEISAVRVDLEVRRGAEVSAERIAPGRVFVHWTDDPVLSTQLDKVVAHYTGQEALSKAVQLGCEAYAKEPRDEQTATTQFGIAVRLAAESGNEKVLRALEPMVEIVDEKAGRVRLRARASLTDIKGAQLDSVKSTHRGQKPEDVPVAQGDPRACASCGRRNRPDARHCEACGKPLSGKGKAS